MNDTIKTIIRNIVEAYGLNCKNIRKENLEVEGNYISGGHRFIIYSYKMKGIGKRIRIDFDLDRNMDADVLVLDL